MITFLLSLNKFYKDRIVCTNITVDNNANNNGNLYEDDFKFKEKLIFFIF